MKAQRLLVVPVLSPVLAVLLVAALNPEPRVSFRVLLWQTPQAPLALWLAGTALGGAALSGGAAALALRQGAARPGRRRLSSRAWDQDPWSQGGEEGWQTVDAAPGVSPRQEAPSPRAPWVERRAAGRRDPGVSVAPPRAPGDPVPTLVVPFRVLRRPGSPAVEDSAPAASAWAPAAAAKARDSVPVAATDDWGEGSAADDW